ncbi:MAG TPA: IS982 family transposase [Candidatus Tectomicrobia bacterium]
MDTFLTTLYVMVDDFCKTSLPLETHPGPDAALTRSEVVTLAIVGQWQGFGRERGFYRYVQRHLHAAFPTLPTRAQFNRQMRQQYEALAVCFLHLVQVLAAQRCPYEALDSSGIPTRDAKRRGAGWLPGLADIGWSNRLGWYERFHLLLAVNPVGMITGFGFGPASTKDQPLAETFFALRCYPYPGLASVGAPA